jgi:GT2 family glycosyltransferase
MIQNSLITAISFIPKSLQAPNAWVGHLPFAAWAIKEVSPNIFVELGTHSGNSYFSFCQAVVEHGLSTKCYAVDTWQGDEHAGQYNEEVFSDVSIHNQNHYSGFSQLLRMTFDDALSHFADESIDLLHIDGLHTYEAVRHDFETWLPKLAPGAVVLFHDTNVRERNFGVWKLWEELQARYPNNLEFMHSCGLGVLQLNNAADDKRQKWLQLDLPEKQSLISYFAALGSRQLESFELAELLTDLKRQIVNLNHAVTERDRQISCLIVDLKAAARNFDEIRRSSSWKITAPLRFVGHLVHGNFDLAGNVIRELRHRIMRYIPTSVQSFARLHYGRLQCIIGENPSSSANHAAIAAITKQRCSFTSDALAADPLCPPLPQTWTAIDISIVTYNSSRWITSFVDSLIGLDYPKSLLTVRFVDNSSTDSTLKDLYEVAPKLSAIGFTVEIMQQPNHGYGAGHNAAISKGTSPFCLVSNIDLIFEPDALCRIAAVALADNEQAAAWELRQKPYEHPKFYDPVTGITNWNSHACVLLRRSALDRVGYYDETLFMYGEDVELSYRLRHNGFLLRYCPQAVIWHYCYENANQTKPIQYTGSTFANLYLRLKYGNCFDALAVPMLGMRLLLAPEVFPGSRRTVMNSLLKLSIVARKALLERRASNACFPFRTWDYELSREGAFLEQHSLPPDPPLVSVITRTYRGRDLYLRQALLSVAHQTYPNIEHIVVEDGGETMRPVIDNINQTTGHTIQFIELDKLGRSATGNAGLSAAKGRWCLFLDDDDLLFAEHIEVLVNTLLDQTNAVAAYSLAWEIVTDSSQLTEGEYLEITHEVPLPLRQDFDYEVLKHRNFMAIQSVLFDRRLFEERGGFELDMDALEDWVLWKKYAQGNRFAYAPKVTSMHKTPGNSLNIAKRQKAFDIAYPLALARNWCYEENNDSY